MRFEKLIASSSSCKLDKSASLVSSDAGVVDTVVLGVRNWLNLVAWFGLAASSAPSGLVKVSEESEADNGLHCCDPSAVALGVVGNLELSAFGSAHCRRRCLHLVHLSCLSLRSHRAFALAHCRHAFCREVEYRGAGIARLAW